MEELKIVNEGLSHLEKIRANLSDNDLTADVPFNIAMTKLSYFAACLLQPKPKPEKESE